MSSRPPPPSGPPPSYAFVTRVYRRNLRPVVITTAFLAAIWTLFSGIGWFRNFGVDKTQHVPKIASLSVALGALYMGVFGIGLFGMAAAGSQRIALVRTYTVLAPLAALIVIATGIARVVTHFVWKDEIISECTNLTTGGEIIYFGFWGPTKAETLDQQSAADWCNSAWGHDSWSEILAMLITSVIAILFALIPFSYYRQLLDPSSAANAFRAPSSQVRGDYPHYNPPYNASVPNLPYAYNARPQYAPPPGPPPGHDESFIPPYDANKPPGYSGDDNGYGDDSKDGKNPFADYDDGPGLREERDVTSRPYPGGPDSFNR